MRVLTIDDVKQIIQKETLGTFFLQLIDFLKQDFARWNDFIKSPRHATHYSNGVIELMPISDQNLYSFKYVNGHPENKKNNLCTVVATGQISDAKTGYPALLSEMTVLTAFRTAATSALCSYYLAPKNSRYMGIIGTGAQSEFQVLAHFYKLGIEEVYYYDIDQAAMDKFSHNLKDYPIKLHRCLSAKEVAEKSDVITTATAKKGHQKVLECQWLQKGVHLNKIGGDCPGKTELDPKILEKAKIIVEFLEQTKQEGEIQQLKNAPIYAELWEIISGKKESRVSKDELTLFDSVGFAIEDYSTLRLMLELAKKHNIGKEMNLIPTLSDPKNLFSLIK